MLGLQWMQVGARIQMCHINLFLYELAQTRFFNLFFLWDFFPGLAGVVVNMKIASFVLEMWFNWHESLWACFPEFVKVCVCAISLFHI